MAMTARCVVVPTSTPAAESPLQLSPVIELVVEATSYAGNRHAQLTDQIEGVFPMAKVYVGRAVDQAMLRTVLDGVARRI